MGFPNISKDSAEYGFGGRFKFNEGDTKIRVLASASEPLATHFTADNKAYVCIGIKNGCPFHGKGAILDKEGKEKKPSLKYPMYILLRDRGELTYAEVAYSIVRALTDLKVSPDWEFDEPPMPYDVTIRYTPKGTPQEMYKVLPSPVKNEIPESIMSELKTKTDLDDVVKNAKMKQHDKLESLGMLKPLNGEQIKMEEAAIEEVDPDDIPLDELPF